MGFFETHRLECDIMEWIWYIIAALGAGVGAIVGTITELFSPSEYDTITVPILVMASLLCVVWI